VSALVMMGLLIASFVLLDQSNWVVIVIELVACVGIFLLIGFLGLGITELFVALVVLVILQISDEETGAVLKILLFYWQVGSALLREKLLPQIFAQIRQGLAAIHVQSQGLECFGFGHDESLVFLFKMLLPVLMIVIACGVVLAKAAVKSAVERCKSKRAHQGMSEFGKDDQLQLLQKHVSVWESAKNKMLEVAL
jgi:hypothetical protein